MIMLCPACNKMEDLKIRKKTSEVVCTECGASVEISPFMKKGMIDKKEFLTDQKKAFAFDCPKCDEQVTGEYNAEKDLCVCTICGTELNISKHMLMVLQSRKLTGTDITPNTSETRLK